MKRKIINKILLVIGCFGLMFVFGLGLFGCGSNRNDLEKKCKPALDYLSSSAGLEFYQIEELRVCNKNSDYLNNGYKNYFDEGEIYKITAYWQIDYDLRNGSYLFGRLDGEPILYVLGNGGLSKMDYFKS